MRAFVQRVRAFRNVIEITLWCDVYQQDAKRKMRQPDHRASRFTRRAFTLRNARVKILRRRSAASLSPFSFTFLTTRLVPTFTGKRQRSSDPVSLLLPSTANFYRKLLSGTQSSTYVELNASGGAERGVPGRSNEISSSALCVRMRVFLPAFNLRDIPFQLPKRQKTLRKRDRR